MDCPTLTALARPWSVIPAWMQFARLSMQLEPSRRGSRSSASAPSLPVSVFLAVVPSLFLLRAIL
ncbi:uncharacterized protein AKAW2_70655S [Aspergillus luchuensis]|uniref:Uncharacterized protein n=1 Tax=Aspergillus kawachii TaxID=1069201 RepID=A0A7R8A3L5_ASPKA|nr:uncharacterized protein AKAW2_70655S [Aspergillus luchuensis]BCS03777.1 hypothetical protein AKAW2_70655S [Aspergillus luchuensis]